MQVCDGQNVAHVTFRRVSDVKPLDKAGFLTHGDIPIYSGGINFRVSKR